MNRENQIASSTQDGQPAPSRLRSTVGRTAGTAAIVAADGMRTVESIADRAGVAKRKGGVSLPKVIAKTVVNPRGMAKKFVQACADEARSHGDRKPPT